MNGKNTGIEKRVLTLLELSKNSENRRPPSPTFSSSSDDDQPPIASSKIRPRAKSAITLGRNYNIELSSLPSKRRGRNHSENLLEPLPVKREISFKTLYGANYLNPPSRNSASQSELILFYLVSNRFFTFYFQTVPDFKTFKPCSFL